MQRCLIYRYSIYIDHLYILDLLYSIIIFLSRFFADHVFHLTEEQTEMAGLYESSLHLFLFNTVYNAEINPDLLSGETRNTAVDLALTKLGTPYSQALRNQEGYFDYSSFAYWLSRYGLNHIVSQVFCTQHNCLLCFLETAFKRLIFYFNTSISIVSDIGKGGYISAPVYIPESRKFG